MIEISISWWPFFTLSDRSFHADPKHRIFFKARSYQNAAEQTFFALFPLKDQKSMVLYVRLKG